jgi:hypothetical protein
LRTRILAALTVAALPLALGAAVSPASAAQSACGHYPPGNAYGIKGGHTTHGGTVTMAARVSYPGSGRSFNCGGKKVVFFVSGPGEYKRFTTGPKKGQIDGDHARFHASGSDTTDGGGLASIAKGTKSTFLWYAAYASDNHTGTAATGNFQVGK